MNQTRRDLMNLFFRRDALRERVYPTRVAYLTLAVVVMVGIALFFVGAARFRESLGLAPLRPPATTASAPLAAADVLTPMPQAVTKPALTVTALPTAQSGSTPQERGSVLAPVPAPSQVTSRCPITWRVQEVAKAGGGRIGLPDDTGIIARVRQDFREAMQWTYSPSQAWNLAEADKYYTPGVAGGVRANLQISLDRQEYIQIEAADTGTMSMSFTPDGTGVTFMGVQHEPITQTVRDVTTKVAKRIVVLNDIPYRLVGVAMLYDDQACHWKIDSINFPEPVMAP